MDDVVDLLDSLIRPLLRLIVLLVRGLWWAAHDWIFETICWGTGWLVLRIVTLGRWPTVGIAEPHKMGDADAMLIALLGLAVLVASGYWFWP